MYRVNVRCVRGNFSIRFLLQTVSACFRKECSRNCYVATSKRAAGETHAESTIHFKFFGKRSPSCLDSLRLRMFVLYIVLELLQTPMMRAYLLESVELDANFVSTGCGRKVRYNV